MPSIIPCVPSCCSTPQTVNVPGSQGNSAITLTTASFVIPVVDLVTTVNVAVVDSSWITAGKNLYIGGANFLVSGVPDATHITLKTLGFVGDTAVGSTVAAGAVVQPGVGNLTSGGIVTPVSIANGGTGSASKGAAQLALGLGQINSFINDTGLAQAFTNAYVAVGSAVTLSQTGHVYLLVVVTVDFIGVTFAAQRTMNFKVRDITAGTDISGSEIDRKTALVTTTSLNSQDYVIACDLSATFNHQIRVFMKIDTVASAGTHQVNSIRMTPIFLTIS